MKSVCSRGNPVVSVGGSTPPMRLLERSSSCSVGAKALHIPAGSVPRRLLETRWIFPHHACKQGNKRESKQKKEKAKMNKKKKEKKGTRKNYWGLGICELRKTCT